MSSCSIGIALVDPDVLLLQRRGLLGLLPHSKHLLQTAPGLPQKLPSSNGNGSELPICNSLQLFDPIFSQKKVLVPPSRSWVSSSEMLPRCLGTAATAARLTGWIPGSLVQPLPDWRLTLAPATWLKCNCSGFNTERDMNIRCRFCRDRI